MDNQEKIRVLTKKLKWYYDIDYKEIAQDLLDMDYQAFNNWINRRCKLGNKRLQKLIDYINCIIEE